jgi:hypothetical protein
VTDSEQAAAMREVAREVLRELVPELLQEALAGPPGNGNGDGDGDGYVRRPSGPHPGAPASDLAPASRADAPPPTTDDVVPQVPAPPVAAVLRPSTWSGPTVAGEVIGGGEASPATASGGNAPPAISDERAPSPLTGPAAGTAASVGPATHVETVTIETDEDLERFVRALVARVENPRDRLAIRAGRLRFTLRRAPTAAGDRPGPCVRFEKGAVTERAVREAAAGGARLELGPGAVLTPLARDQARALGVEIERKRRC